MTDYVITLKAKIDFSNVDPAILQNGRLEQIEKFAMVYKFLNPVNTNPNPNPNPNSGLYIPGQIYFETRNDQIDGLHGFSPQNGGVADGSCHIADDVFTSYDVLGFHLNLRQYQSSSPFGLLDSVQLDYRVATTTYSGVDMPIDHNPLVANHVGDYCWVHVRRPGVGAGLDAFPGFVTASAIDIEVI